MGWGCVEMVCGEGVWCLPEDITLTAAPPPRRRGSGDVPPSDPQGPWEGGGGGTGPLGWLSHDFRGGRACVPGFMTEGGGRGREV